jgi:heme-degrading monooxygenase HmoA
VALDPGFRRDDATLHVAEGIVVIVYEVRAVVQAEIAQAYREWLEPHVREILAIEGFTGAQLLAEENEDGERVWTVCYHLDSRAALERYLRDHAPRLRADADARFGDAFKATRRVLELVRTF